MTGRNVMVEATSVNVMLLALKMEEGGHEPRVAFRSWKRQRNRLSLEASRKKERGPADTLTFRFLTSSTVKMCVV